MTKKQIAELQDQKARQTNNIKHFLKPWLSFRMAVVYKGGKRVHLYGNEHGVNSYNQLIYGHVPFIVLSRNKGYTDLLKYYEKESNSILSATIYMREKVGEVFSVKCRAWYQGDEPLEINDPVIDAGNDQRILYYYIDEKRNIIFSEKPFQQNETAEQKNIPHELAVSAEGIDFKSEVAKALRKKK